MLHRAANMTDTKSSPDTSKMKIEQVEQQPVFEDLKAGTNRDYAGAAAKTGGDPISA